ncbi:MAG TPA: wax ester/triacylglycerol synthase family O-acyltransferase [Candidatus Binataceae bacterium]|nr:wax ester/triacylglycerol synthase family O-acyltransferase [Candidatus Binataceae bacterium]
MASGILGGGTRSYRLSTQDATFIYAESQSGPLHIGSIGLLEGRIEFEEVRRHVTSRIHLIPRYRQRLAPVPFNIAHAMMEDDPEFSVDHHVFEHELAPGLSEAAALSAIMRNYETPLDRERPLWDVHIYHGLEGARTAVVWRVHHCLVDGVSGVELLKVMYDFRPDPEPAPAPETPWAPNPPSSGAARFIEAARAQLHATLEGAQQAAREVMSDPAAAAKNAQALAAAARTMTELATRRIARTPWNAGIATGRREIAWTRQSFADFRAIRQAFGGSVNDVVLTILTEGAARYLAHHGYLARGEELCIGCPVNVRHRDERSALGNRVSMMFPTAPAEPTDIVERLKVIAAETERIKAAGSAQALESLMRMAEGVPPALVAMSARMATGALDAAAALAQLSGWKPAPGGFALPAAMINFIATNVPGVQVPLYLLGHRCLDMIPLVPLGATLGYGVAILSYNRSLYFGMMAEPRLMPDVALMRAFVDDAFAELRRRGHERAGVAERVMAGVAAAARG